MNAAQRKKDRDAKSLIEAGRKAREVEEALVRAHAELARVEHERDEALERVTSLLATHEHDVLNHGTVSAARIELEEKLQEATTRIGMLLADVENMGSLIGIQRKQIERLKGDSEENANAKVRRRLQRLQEEKADLQRQLHSKTSTIMGGRHTVVRIPLEMSKDESPDAFVLRVAKMILDSTNKVITAEGNPELLPADQIRQMVSEGKLPETALEAITEEEPPIGDGGL